MRRWLTILGCVLVASLASGQGGETGGGGGPGSSGPSNLSTLTDDAACLGGNLVLRNAGDSAFDCFDAGAGGLCLTSGGNGQLPTWGACGGSSISMPTARLLGRTTPGTGAAENIQVGSSFTLSSLVLDIGEIVPTKIDSDTPGDYGNCVQFGPTGTLIAAAGSCGTSTGMSSWLLSGDAATTATVGQADVGKLVGGTGITTSLTSVDPTHTVTFNLDLTDGVSCPSPLSCTSNSISTNLTSPGFMGRSLSGAGVATTLNATAATALLVPYSAGVQGLVPSTGLPVSAVTGGTANMCAQYTAGGTLSSAGSACGGSGGALATLSDVTLSSPLTDSILVKSGGNWIDGPLNLGGGAAAITGTLPLANLADNDTTSGLCLVSGGSGGGIPNYVACGGFVGGTLTANLVLSSDTNEGITFPGVGDCSAETQTLLWNSTTNKVTCGSDSGAAGGGIGTVEELDGLPSVTSTTKLVFDQKDGFMVSGSTGTATVDLAETRRVVPALANLALPTGTSLVGLAGLDGKDIQQAITNCGTDLCQIELEAGTYTEVCLAIVGNDAGIRIFGKGTGRTTLKPMADPDACTTSQKQIIEVNGSDNVELAYFTIDGDKQNVSYTANPCHTDAASPHCGAAIWVNSPGNFISKNFYVHDAEFKNIVTNPVYLQHVDGAIVERVWTHDSGCHHTAGAPADDGDSTCGCALGAGCGGWDGAININTGLVATGNGIRSKGTGIVAGNQAKDIVIRDNVVEKAMYTGIEVFDSYGTGVAGSHYEIYRNDVATSPVGIVVNGGKMVTIRDNWVHNNTITNATGDHGGGIQSSGGNVYGELVVENNYVENNDSNGIYLKSTTGRGLTVRNNVVANNCLHHNNGANVMLWSGDGMPAFKDLLVESNIVTGSSLCSSAMETTLAASSMIGGAIRIIGGSYDDDVILNTANMVVQGLDVTGTLTYGATASGLEMKNNATTTVYTAGSKMSKLDDGVLKLSAGTSPGKIELVEPSAGGSSSISFQAPALGGNRTYILPDALGSAGYQLTNDGSGTLSWQLAGGTSGTAHSVVATACNGAGSPAGVAGDLCFDNDAASDGSLYYCPATCAAGGSSWILSTRAHTYNGTSKDPNNLPVAGTGNNCSPGQTDPARCDCKNAFIDRYLDTSNTGGLPPSSGTLEEWVCISAGSSDFWQKVPGTPRFVSGAGNPTSATECLVPFQDYYFNTTSNSLWVCTVDEPDTWAATGSSGGPATTLDSGAGGTTQDILYDSGNALWFVDFNGDGAWGVGLGETLLTGDIKNKLVFGNSTISDNTCDLGDVGKMWYDISDDRWEFCELADLTFVPKTLIPTDFTQIKASPGDHRVIVSSATNASAWTSSAVPTCDEAHTLNYNTSTHNFDCTSVDGGGGAATTLDSGVGGTTRDILYEGGTSNLWYVDGDGNGTWGGGAGEQILLANITTKVQWGSSTVSDDVCDATDAGKMWYDISQDRFEFCELADVPLGAPKTLGTSAGTGLHSIHHVLVAQLGANSIYGVTDAEASTATVISNSAVGVDMVVGLPDARQGMELWIVLEDGSKDLHIEPRTQVGDAIDDKIDAPEVVGTGDGLSWSCGSGCAPGSLVHLIAMADNEWRVMQVKGQAPTDNNNTTSSAEGGSF